MMFKVGDEVICVDPDHCLTLGMAYAIKTVDSDGFVIVSKVDPWRWYSPKRFVYSSPLIRELF
jgi:hypothetical protein